MKALTKTNRSTPLAPKFALAKRILLGLAIVMGLGLLNTSCKDAEGETDYGTESYHLLSNTTPEISGKDRVYLGGNSSGSSWRTSIKELLNIDFYDPTLADSSQMQEIDQMSHDCDFKLFVISPKVDNTESIRQFVNSSKDLSEQQTLLCILEQDDSRFFSGEDLKEMNNLKVMAQNHGVKTYQSLDDVADYLNHTKEIK